MKRNFVDYHGPTGPFIATDRGILPLTSAEGMAAAMDSAMLVSLGHTENAARYQRLIERPMSVPTTGSTELRYGLPGTPEQRRQGIRSAMRRHAETLRRLAE
jgi:hypothetical protein